MNLLLLWAWTVLIIRSTFSLTPNRILSCCEKRRTSSKALGRPIIWPISLPPNPTCSIFFVFIHYPFLIFVVDPSCQKKLTLGDQHQLVHFSIKPQYIGRISHAQRLLSRLHVRRSQRPPLSLWVGWVLECILSHHSFLSWLLMICLMTYFLLPKLHFLILTAYVITLII